MRTVVGGTRRAAPPQVQPRPDLRHYFATNQWEASWAGLHVQPRPRCSPASICRLQPGASPQMCKKDSELVTLNNNLLDGKN